MRSLLRALLILPALCVAGLTVAAEAPLPTVPQVDLARYAGRWHEIALLPNRFQRQCVSDTQASYRQDGDRIEVVNRCRMADGRIDDIRGHAKVVPDSGNARLRVTFFWPFYGDYWILALDEGYTEVLVGAPNRRYAWILARDPQLPEARIEALLARAAALGFDRSAFQRTPQSADAAGRP